MKIWAQQDDVYCAELEPDEFQTFVMGKTDTLILAAASTHYTKIAVIISKVYDAFEAEGLELTKTLAQEIAARVYILVDSGALECQGNMRRWREADIRLPSKED